MRSLRSGAAVAVTLVLGLALVGTVVRPGRHAESAEAVRVSADG